MLESFKQFCSHNSLFSKTDRILLTVSGGIDSMTMLYLFKQMGQSIGVAHCNFQLRGQESDEDEQFVRTTTEILNIPFYTVKFETALYAEENHLSIQMAARELRYAWFENLRKSYDYQYVATAHNADDSLETFFINLSRGCGIDGLTGIRPISGNIIRPMLFAPREMITQFQKRKGILFREDSSNHSDKYLRNYIRHHIIPALEEASPSFRKGMQTTLKNLISNQSLYHQHVSKMKENLVTTRDGLVIIDISGLIKTDQPVTILWEILHDYQFNGEICEEIAQTLEAQSGKMFYSPTHRLIKDRDKLLITKIPGNEHPVYYIEQENPSSYLPISLDIQFSTLSDIASFERNAPCAMMDFNQLEWPLILRKWRPGDYFMPLGMEHLKKVSDFFIDLKLSIPEKEAVWILESGNRIAWIVGIRLDHRFRIRETTRKIVTFRVN